MVWLGEGTEKNSELFDFLGPLANQYEVEDPKPTRPFPPHGMARKLREVVDGPSWVLTSLSELARRSYWRRIWIVQEIALPRRHRIFAGNSSLQKNALVLLYILAVSADTTWRRILRESPMGRVLEV